MTTSSCNKCGGRIIFRPYITKKDGTRYRPKGARVFPIHVDGTCGQMQLGIAA